MTCAGRVCSGLACALALGVPGLASRASAAGGASRYPVLAVRQPLTRTPGSPVAHDTETMALTPHAGHLFAATDQWEYGGAGAAGQILVKASSSSPWTIFERTQSLRVQALDSFAIPADQGLGPGHSLLVTQAIVDGRSRIQWLIDGAHAFTPANSYALPTTAADVRAFGAHTSGGRWSVYAGVNPVGVLRGTWSPRRRTLVFDPHPELTVAPPASPGLKTRKVTGFADCAGALYVTINTRLFRRNDGPLRPGVARWVLVYQEPAVGPFNSGLRGLTCIDHAGHPALLVSTEGSGDVYRFDHLPRGQLHAGPTAGPGRGVAGLAPIPEFSPATAIRAMLAAHGTTVPGSGAGSISYVIAAYNRFATLRLGGAARQLFGLEWAYRGGCPANRTCAPSGFDAAACFAVRTDDRGGLSYALRCLAGPSLTPSRDQPSPVRSGQAFVSVRTIALSPFGDGRIYYGGYDCNFHPADGTAWIASSAAGALHLPVVRRHS